MSTDELPTELGRVQAEHGRERAEDSRENAEQGREVTEGHRHLAESSRKDAEQFGGSATIRDLKDKKPRDAATRPLEAGVARRGRRLAD